MKFGKTLVIHQIPEWSTNYINYKQLKKIIKTIDAGDGHGIDDPDALALTLSQFFFELDRNIETVDDFYNTKFIEYNRRLDKIVSVLGYSDDTKTIGHPVDSHDELDEIISILLELRTIFRNLKWYAELNHRGFVKILKKLDKKLTALTSHLDTPLQGFSNNNKDAYLLTRVNALPFANGLDLISSLNTISTIIKQLSDIDDFPDKLTVENFNRLKIARKYSYDQETLDQFTSLVNENNSGELEKQLTLKKQSLKFLNSLLNKAALINATACIDVLLKVMFDQFEDPLYDKSDISGRNFFHQHLIGLGKKQLNINSDFTPGETTDLNRFFSRSESPEAINEKISIDGLIYIINHIGEKYKHLLVEKDNYFRTPLHYAAQYGLASVVLVWLDQLKEALLLPKNISIDNLEYWGDQECLTPLHLAIIGRHPKTVKTLVASLPYPLCTPQLLLIAVRMGSPEILDCLIRKGGINIDYTDLENHHETALYIAAKLNLYETVEFLLTHDANVEIGESVFGWTPIFIAANEGFESIVKLLLEFGAKYDQVDDSGWLPMEHACLRGHLALADLLKPQDPSILMYDMYHPENNVPRVPPARSELVLSNKEFIKSTSSIEVLPEHSRHAVDKVYKQLKNNNSSNGRNDGSYKPPKSFGHRYLNADESLILITLGTTDLRDNVAPVDLNKLSLTKTFNTELDTALSLLISCKLQRDNLEIGPPVIIDLPLEDNHGSATDPVSFRLPDGLSTDDIVVTFDLIPTYQYPSNQKGGKLFGRAIALLKDAYTKVGPNLRSLNNKITIPILESMKLDVLGTIRFEYMLVTPFSHPDMSITSSDTYWKQLVSTRVIGHRGLGKNVSDKKSLQLGENTVESFVAAASLGASYVEFDVQLTKDFVPVVYHDFTVAESGVDIPMHTLTAEQFLGLKEDSKKSDDKNNCYEPKRPMDESKMRPRSMSAYPSAPNFHFKDNTVEDDEDDAIEKEFRDQISRRMKLTKTWKEKGFKGNARGMQIASDFVTLRDLFKKLPMTVGFNIELKYPMLDEAEEESMGEIAIDLNVYVDTILKEIYDVNTNGRDVIFSSFHPDVCILLSLKQPTIPILFLTESGTTNMADIRASSLQNAIRFAKKWNLLGIVSAAEALVKTPRLAQVVKSSGLVCVTYGTLNNEPELAKVQMKAGVDAVIVDSVLGVREGIRHEQEVLNQLELASMETSLSA